MMKRKYNEPEMSVIKLQTEDIIRTSTGEFDGEWVMFGTKSSEDNLVS